MRFREFKNSCSNAVLIYTDPFPHKHVSHTHTRSVFTARTFRSLSSGGSYLRTISNQQPAADGRSPGGWNSRASLLSCLQTTGVKKVKSQTSFLLASNKSPKNKSDAAAEGAVCLQAWMKSLAGWWSSDRSRSEKLWEDPSELTSSSAASSDTHPLYVTQSCLTLCVCVWSRWDASPL